MRQNREMAFFLAKSEPGTYSIEQLEAEKRTTWDGVTNPQAVKNIRSMRPGDTVFIYHSGGQSAIVGWAEVLSEPRNDPGNPRSAVVDLAFRGKLETPVSLSEVKQTKQFDDWSLVRQSRLSTMPVPVEFVAWLRQRTSAKF